MPVGGHTTPGAGRLPRLPRQAHRRPPVPQEEGQPRATPLSLVRQGVTSGGQVSRAGRPSPETAQTLGGALPRPVPSPKVLHLVGAEAETRAPSSRVARQGTGDAALGRVRQTHILGLPTLAPTDALGTAALVLIRLGRARREGGGPCHLPAGADADMAGLAARRDLRAGRPPPVAVAGETNAAMGRARPSSAPFAP